MRLRAMLWRAAAYPIMVLGGLVAILIFLPLAFPLTLFARVLWIYLDHAVDPETRS